MKKYDFLSGLFLMILSIGVCLMADRLGLGNIYNPGAGLIPFGVAALLGLMSIGLWLKSLLEVTKGYQERQVFKGIQWGRVVLVLCALLGYGIAFNFLGFHICTFLLMILLLGVGGRLKWWLTITVSLVITFCAYIIFEAWLDCSFPMGTFGV
jgi:putative tricarboxylic transport membrane protein